MYLKNPYYLEAVKADDRRTQARIKIGDLILINENIKNLKYDLNINENEKFSIGGAYGATVTLTLLNQNGEFNDIKFENKEFVIDLKISMEDLYTVAKFNTEFVKIINALKVKHMTSLWVPQGKFYPTEIVKNENKTITIKLSDKTKYLEDDYVCRLTPPFTLKQLYDDVHEQFQIVSNTFIFYNQDKIIERVPERIYRKTNFGIYSRMCMWVLHYIQRWKWGNKAIWNRKCEIYFKGQI